MSALPEDNNPASEPHAEAMPESTPEVSAEDFNTRNEAVQGFAEQHLLYPLAAAGGG